MQERRRGSGEGGLAEETARLRLARKVNQGRARSIEDVLHGACGREASLY